MSTNHDRVVRAITDDGSFRVITASTTNTVRGILEAQSASGMTARWLGDLVTGTIIVRETMAPQLRVQGILRGSGGRGTLVADSHPDGSTRGLVSGGGSEKTVACGAGALLQMMRTLPSGMLHQGVVEVPEDADLAHALPRAFMAYMQTSEQVTSVLSVATVGESSETPSAAGYIVQLLPEAREGMLMVMTERLRDFEQIDELVKKGNADPHELMRELLYGMPFTVTQETEVAYHCGCNHVRVVAGLSTLSRTEIEELLSDARVLEISCDFCGKNYEIAPHQLRGLLDKS